MSRAQLAILPIPEGRQAERRVVNLAARLRDPGARIGDAEVLNLSTDGFMAETELDLEPGTYVWLKLAGLEPQCSRCVWVENGKAGFQFATALHPATVEMLAEANRKPPVRNHFGIAGQQNR